MKAKINKFTDFKVFIPKKKYDIDTINRFDNYDFNNVSAEQLIEDATTIIQQRHIERKGEGEYTGFDYSMAGTNKGEGDLMMLFLEKKKYKLLRMSTKEVDIVIMAYQNKQLSIFVDAVFEHFLPYLFHLHKKYIYANRISLTDGDLISEFSIVLVTCMKKYKLGYFVGWLRSWIRYTSITTGRVKNFQLMNVPLSIHTAILKGEREAYVKNVSNSRGEQLIDLAADKNTESEDDMLSKMSVDNKELFDKVVAIAGVEPGLIFCYNEGLFTPDNKKYRLKEIGKMFNISSSTASRRKKMAIERLKDSKFILDLYGSYDDRKMFKA